MLFDSVPPERNAGFAAGSGMSAKNEAGPAWLRFASTITATGLTNIVKDDSMIDNSELVRLVKEARSIGTIIRTKHDATDCIVGVSIGKVPGGEYRRLGEPGTGWMPPIAAAARLREIINDHFDAHLKRATEIVSRWPEWKQKVLG